MNAKSNAFARKVRKILGYVPDVEEAAIVVRRRFTSQQLWKLAGYFMAGVVLSGVSAFLIVNGSYRAVRNNKDFVAMRVHAESHPDEDAVQKMADKMNESVSKGSEMALNKLASGRTGSGREAIDSESAKALKQMQESY